MIINTKLGKKVASASSIFAYGGLASTDTVHCVKGLLPYEYQELTYIQSTGTQYIDLGSIGTMTSISMAIKYRILSCLNPSSGGDYLWGVHTSDTGYGRFSGYVASSSTYRFFANTGLTTEGAYVEYTYSVNTDYTDIFTRNADGSWSISGSHTYSGSSTFTDLDDCHFGLFSIINNPDLTTTRPGNQRIYYATLTVNGSVFRNLIPCYRKSDGVNGLYDTVNGVFYTNAGTGTFTRGTEVTTTSYTGTWTSKTVSSVVENGWLFSDITTLGTYTVSATRSSTTITENVLIDAIADYDVEMDFS